MYGDRPYDKSETATDCKLLNFWYHGEENHNFHHAFPQDYRGTEKKSYPFSSIIEIFEKLGWATDLKKTSDDVIAKRWKRTGDGTHVDSKQ